MIKKGYITPILLPVAILAGLAVGTFLPGISDSKSMWIDPLVLILLFLLFLEIRFNPIPEISKNRSIICLVWVTNFLIVPLFAWGIATLFFKGQPALFAGLLLYMLFPCTDWFLAFTRIAKGDVALGSVLMPINLISQLLLFPVYVSFFIGLQSDFNLSSIWPTLGQWFLLPFISAMVIRYLVSRFLSPPRFDFFLKLTGSAIPWVLAILVFCVFSAHTSQLVSYPKVFPLVLLAVFLFFVSTWFLGELLARRFELTRPQHVLLAMTTTARNSPLMLGLATIVLPDQPMVYAVLIIGMLVEFPHLTFLTRVFRGRNDRYIASTSEVLPSN